MDRFVSKLRLISGLVLACYVVQHLINHAFGIVSIANAESYRLTIGSLFQTTPGLILIYASLLIHLVIALRSIFYRSSLRMPPWQWAQLILGLSILPLLVGHISINRGFHLLGNIDPGYNYVVTTLLLKPVVLFKLLGLLLVVWIHMVIGLHFWLRVKKPYPAFIAYAYGVVLIIPTLAYVGIFNMYQEASGWVYHPAQLDHTYQSIKEMDRDALLFLYGFESKVLTVFALLLVLTIVARQLRLWLHQRKDSYLISCANGKTVPALNGSSLLEGLRMASVPHASVCGGRARCTTCRVRIGTGLADLPPAKDLEKRALQRIAAEDDIRLACQLYPTANLAITPLVMPQTALTNIHQGGVQGHEEYVVAMFVDMRGSTDMGERVLAYDVVFILNRFFTELSDALSNSHGHYAQFAGDGLMALYGLDPARKSQACKDALNGALDMFERIQKLNLQLQQEFGETVQMGIGIHGGDAIVGTMGPPKTPLLTAVGDNINIAARLEAKTKDLNCDLIVSTSTLREESIAFPDDHIAKVDVRGRIGQVEVYCLNQQQITEIIKPEQ